MATTRIMHDAKGKYSRPHNRHWQWLANHRAARREQHDLSALADALATSGAPALDAIRAKAVERRERVEEGRKHV